MLSRVLSVLLVLFLIVGVPILSLSTGRDSQVRQMPRLALYFSATISQWALGALGLLIFFLSPLSASSVGFRRLPPVTVLVWAGALVVLSVAGICLGIFLERRGWWPPEAEMVSLLIPRTRYEKFWSVLVLAPTAALCEEFLYRGFLLAQLSQWLRSGTWGWVASTLAFGLAHVYQGWHGTVRAALLGALLAYPVVHFGSLYPSMLAHGLIDALSFAWLGPKFLSQELLSEEALTSHSSSR
jgi:membrane protease YdiL (CAAX protease family)